MYFEELKVGMTAETAPAPIEKEKMLSFAREYDDAPIHTDEAYAEKSFFGQLLAPGVMSFLAVWARYLEKDFFGEELLAGKSVKIEWKKPVFAGDVLTGRAAIIDLIIRNERNGIAVLSLDAYNQKGELVLTSVTEAVLKRKR